MTKTELISIGERAGWTALQAGAAFAVTDLGHISTWWALPLATALSMVKTFAMGRVKAVKSPATGEVSGG